MQNCSQYRGDGLNRVIHLWPFQVPLHLLTAESDDASSTDTVLLCSWQYGPCGETILGSSCALRTCPGSCPVLGAASLTRLSLLAAPWRGWDLFLVAHWKPSIWLPVSPGCGPWPVPGLRRRREQVGGVILLLGQPGHGLPLSMWHTSWHQRVEETLNTCLGPWC